MSEFLILPTLYKKTSTGAIEMWRIRAVPAMTGDDAFLIVTEYGHVDGKLQESCERIEIGKNIGKKNETTPMQQAHSQAKSEWNTKLTRKGYVEKLDQAEAGLNSGAGGIRPMLAKAFEDVEKKFEFPCYAQPKLDGIRCIAVVGEDNVVTLWSREQKPITAVPHIARSVESLYLPVGTVLDGELYNHDLKDDFEKIVSAVRKQGPVDQASEAMIQYHVYDLPRHTGLPKDAHFGERTTLLHLLMPNATCAIRLVETRLVTSREDLIAYRTACQKRGYEGAMARALEPYAEGKRSAALAKLKEFIDSEFLIIDVEEGVGKMAGCAIFVCTTIPPSIMAVNPDTFEETLFRCKMEGELESLKKYVQDKKLAVGKLLTVKYFSLTAKGKPRFPVGKAVRDYEGGF